MNLFDIIGPVMVGPSSSHTAGACRIGEAARRLMAEPVAEAGLYFHGSFATTGRGHGTDRALVAGLLGMDVDDQRIPDAFDYAKKAGMNVTIGTIDLGPDAHPNSVLLKLTGTSGHHLEIIACSTGGGQVEIRDIDGLKAHFSCNHPTLIVQNNDTPGIVSFVTGLLYERRINIATIQLDRDSRGGHAVTVLELDQEVPKDILDRLNNEPAIVKVTYYSLEGNQ